MALLGVIGLGLGMLLAGAWAARAAYVSDKLADAASDRAPVSRAFMAGWPQGTGPRVLLIGDSRVSDWRHVLPPGLRVVERGLPGETVVQLTRRFAVDGLGAKPDVMLVQAGVNDLVAASLMPPEDRARALRSMAAAYGAMEAQARAAGVCVLLSTIVPPAEPALMRRLVWNAEVQAMVSAANTALRRLSAERGVPLLDLAALLAQDAPLPERYRKDTLHLTPAAYDRMNDALRERLQDLPPGACEESEIR